MVSTSPALLRSRGSHQHCPCVRPASELHLCIPPCAVQTAHSHHQVDAAEGERDWTWLTPLSHQLLPFRKHVQCQNCTSMSSCSPAATLATVACRSIPQLHAGVLSCISGLGASGLPGVVPMAHPVVSTREGFEARLGLCTAVIRACLALKTLTGPAFSAQLDAFMKSFVWAAKNNPDFFNILGRSLPGIALGGAPGVEPGSSLATPRIGPPCE